MHKKTISAVILPLLTLFVLLLQSCPSPTPVSPPNPKTVPDKPGEIVKDSKGRVIGTVTIEKTPKESVGFGACRTIFDDFCLMQGGRNGA